MSNLIERVPSLSDYDLGIKHAVAMNWIPDPATMTERQRELLARRLNELGNRFASRYLMARNAEELGEQAQAAWLWVESQTQPAATPAPQPPPPQAAIQAPTEKEPTPPAPVATKRGPRRTTDNKRKIVETYLKVKDEVRQEDFCVQWSISDRQLRRLIDLYKKGKL